ncbi:hypothetical protein Holit_01870 [Hollandina sp. SP2]
MGPLIGDTFETRLTMSGLTLPDQHSPYEARCNGDGKERSLRNTRSVSSPSPVLSSYQRFVETQRNAPSRRDAMLRRDTTQRSVETQRNAPSRHNATLRRDTTQFLRTGWVGLYPSGFTPPGPADPSRAGR